MGVISIKGLSKSFGKKTVLDNIDLEFKEGTIYGLLGRNGAGKSTLMNLIAGRLAPDCGSVTVDDIVTHENDTALSKIHLMSEQTLYYPAMKVFDMFETAALFYGGYDMEYAKRLCEEYKLDGKKKLQSLSTGYRTVAKLINALACGAEVIMLDEPVLGLDAAHRDMFYRQLTDRYAETGATFIVSTHIIDEIAGIMEKAVIINDGKIILHKDTDDMRSMGFSVSGKAELVDSFTRGMNIIGEDAIPGVKCVYVLGTLSENKVPEGLEINPLGLNSLFIHLTNT